MKKFTAMILSLVMVLSVALLAGCSSKNKTEGNSSGEGDKPAKKYTLKLGYSQNEKDPLTMGLYQMAENVKERTDGNFVIEVYPSGQLGATADVMEQSKSGANVGCLTDAGRLAEMVPEIGILNAPYLFDSFDEGMKIVNSDLWKSWEDELAEKHNYKVLAFNYYQGARHLLTNKPIEKPEDLNGLRLRTPGSPVWQATIAAMGAKPTALAWAEVYPGLQQKVIDGAEAQHPGTYGAKLYEVIDYITKTGHFQLLTGLVIGNDYYNKLPQEYKDILAEEAVKAGEFASNTVLESLDTYEKEMIDAGVTVNDVDLTPFKEATSKVYDDIEGYRELKDKFDDLLGK